MARDKSMLPLNLLLLLIAEPVFAQSLSEYYRQDEETKRMLMLCVTIILASGVIAIGLFFGLRGRKK